MSRSRSWCRPVLAALLVMGAIGALLVHTGPPAAAKVPIEGSEVHVGSPPRYGHSHGTALVPVYLNGEPGSGQPDFWAYCLENRVDRKEDRGGIVGGWDSFVGSNFFATDPVVARKVAWILVHSYPAVDLVDLSMASGVEGLTEQDAIEATQYAIWRFTDLDFDANWQFENQRSASLYWYLVEGAHAHGGYTEAELHGLGATVEMTGPSSTQVAGSLAGPFTVSSNRSTVAITVDPNLPITDADGTPLDPLVVAAGREFFVDLRESTDSGDGRVVAEVESSAGTGMVVSVDTHLPERAQTLVLVAAAGTTVEATAAFGWKVAPGPNPSISTSVAVEGSKTALLPITGGTVIDTVRYEGLTPGAEYVLEGSVHRPSDGSGIGITGSTSFRPSSESGSIDVVFTVTGDEAAEFAGRDLVVFERLLRDGQVVAEHVDPNDRDQTFRVDGTNETTTTANDAGSTTTVVARTIGTPAGSTGTEVSGSGSGVLPRTGAAVRWALLWGGGLLFGGAAVLRFRRCLAHR